MEFFYFVTAPTQICLQRCTLKMEILYMYSICAMQFACSRKRSSRFECVFDNCLFFSDLKELFPGIDLSQRDICVMNLTQKTDTDMSAWSTEMEIERMQLTSAASNHYLDH